MTVTIDGTTGVSLVQDGVVATADLADNAVTSAKLFSGFANGITMADHWRLPTAFDPSEDPDLVTGWEQVDDGTFTNIGSAMTQSSGLFTFPETGIYLVLAQLTHQVETGGDFTNTDIRISTDSGSTFDGIGRTQMRNSGTSRLDATKFAPMVVDVTNATTFRLGVYAQSFASTSGLAGVTDISLTSLTFIRLGDT